MAEANGNRDKAPVRDRREISEQVPQAVREVLAEQPDDRREVLEKVVESWLEPAERLKAMQRRSGNGRNGDDFDEPPAYHVPSAEGIAVYEGIFGSNGDLSDEDKELLQNLLSAVIAKPKPNVAAGRARSEGAAGAGGAQGEEEDDAAADGHDAHLTPDDGEG